MPNALVTGGAVRIGQAIALGLSRAGFAVAIHYRDSEQHAAELAALIREQGGRAATVRCDLASQSDTAGLVDRATRALGPIDCLVNNASLFRHDTLADLTADGWDAHIAVNLRTPVFLARAMADGLPAGMDASVVNIIDQRVHNAGPDFFSYTISKAALLTATRMLAQALAPRVRVNAVAPGPVLQSVHQTPEAFAAEARSTLLGHGATPEDIANAVCFLVTAPAITGQMITVDAGQHLTHQPAG